ncbi:hypothetical protein B0H16DRAFT_1453172 [Mycena metata]|uniref:Uncharacterized protein n=1 Tax=Mycena metata TaxID=1033252 RepID=A0AAD7NP88_9AGAR|nr:hypothetical protein B0H16DRAFT_1453172 [Mycena metata]
MADAPPPYDKSSSRPPRGEKASTSRNSVSSTSTKSAALLQTPKRRSVVGLFRHTPEPSNVLVTVKAAVLEDVSKLVQPYAPDSVADRVGVLETCAQLCARYKLDFSGLLQGQSIENHSALYWVIANGPLPLKAPFELVAAVLAHSAPLQPATIKEARQACISFRSQEMFQFLRMSPDFGALPTEDRFLLGVLAPPEEIVVEEMEGASHPFSLRFKIPMFYRRMMLGKQIVLEFIAQGRLWKLTFFTADKPISAALTHGKWSVDLRMVEKSPPTHAVVALVIFDARPSPPLPTPFWKSADTKNKWLCVDRQSGPQKETKFEDLVGSWSWTLFQQ